MVRPGCFGPLNSIIPAGVTMPSRLVRCLVAALGLLLLDQGTKFLAVSELTDALQEVSGVTDSLKSFWDRQHPTLGDSGNARAVELGGALLFRYSETPGVAEPALSNLPSSLR